MACSREKFISALMHGIDNSSSYIDNSSPKSSYSEVNFEELL
jgi:hypothetical protein